MIRIEDKSNFEYLLRRGIKISVSDSRNNNSLHHSIKLEKPQFLSFMLEGSWDGFDIFKAVG